MALLVALIVWFGVVAFASPTIATPAPTSADLAQVFAPAAPTQSLQDDIDAARTSEQAGILGGREMLPAWRWGDGAASGFHTRYTTDWQHAIKEIQYPVMNGLGSMMFAIASMIWSLILWLVWTAITTDLLSSAARPINDGYATLGNAITKGPILALAVVLGVVWAGMQAFKGGAGAGVRAVVRTLLPLGIMLAMLSAASGVPTDAEVRRALRDPDYTFQPNPGSPGWLAVRGGEVSTDVAASLAHGFVQGTDLGLDADRDALSCVNYRRALHEWFEATAGGGAWWKGLARATSHMWEETYLVAWRDAQFGRSGIVTPGASSTLPEAVDCRALERYTHGWDQIDQVITANGAVGPLPPRLAERRTTPTANFDSAMNQGNSASLAFQRLPGDGNEQAIHYWAKCAYIGGQWVLRPEFANVKIGDGLPDPGENDCADWWNADDNQDDLTIDFGNGLRASKNIESSGYPQNEDAFKSYILAYHGFNGNEKIVLGLLSIAVAIAFLISLGGIAVGAIVAQLAFTLTIVLLPVILVAIAWPSDNTSQVANKILKVLFGTLAAKSLFILVLSGLVIMVSSTRALLGDWAAAPGVTGAISSAAIPLAAMWIFRYLLKQIGLGNILSVKGAVNMTATMARYQPDAGSSMFGNRVRRAIDPTYRYSTGRRLLRAGTGGLGRAAKSLPGVGGKGDADSGPQAPAPLPGGDTGGSSGNGPAGGPGGAPSGGPGGPPSPTGGPVGDPTAPAGGGAARPKLATWARGRVQQAGAVAGRAGSWARSHAPHLALGAGALIATGLAAPAAGLVGTVAGAATSTVGAGGAALAGGVAGTSAVGAHMLGAGVVGGGAWAVRRTYKHVKAGNRTYGRHLAVTAPPPNPLSEARSASRRVETAAMPDTPPVVHQSPFPSGGTPTDPTLVAPALVPTGSGSRSASGGEAPTVVNVTNNVTHHTTVQHTEQHRHVSPPAPQRQPSRTWSQGTTRQPPQPPPQRGNQ